MLSFCSTTVTKLCLSTRLSVMTSTLSVLQVKENLLSCKMLLHCKRDELRKLWIEGIEHKHVLQLLDEIESIKQVPQRLETYMASKHYLHATDMLVSRLITRGLAVQKHPVFMCVWFQLDKETDRQTNRLFFWLFGWMVCAENIQYWHSAYKWGKTDRAASETNHVQHTSINTCVYEVLLLRLISSLVPFILLKNPIWVSNSPVRGTLSLQASSI